MRVEIIFRKKGTAENGVIDFEIGDIGSSAHWYWSYTAVILLMCLEMLGEGFFCLPEIDCKGVCTKPLSPLKLYQRFWI